MRKVALALASLLAAAAAAQTVRPLPASAFEQSMAQEVRLPGRAPDLPWPNHGQGVIEVVGAGTLGSFGGDEPVPIASVTKVMTAVVILDTHPLQPGEDGPAITVTAADADRYRSAAGTLESVVAVSEGQTMTLRQALEGLLIASANNFAPMLARWDAGSERAFVAKMNAKARELGLEQTRYADTIGLDVGSVSTARDQVRLATVAMRDEVFAQVVAQRQADLPIVGRVANYNSLAGTDGIVGVKTGSSRAAGGCLVFAIEHEVGGRAELIVGALLGQRDGPFLPAVLSRSQRLAAAARAAVTEHVVVSEGDTVGRITTGWGASVAVVAGGEVRVAGWPGLGVRVAVESDGARSVRRGDRVGTLVVAGAPGVQEVSLVATGNVARPSAWWRLTRR